MRLLIIEDDKDLCNALKLTLDKEGIALDICNDGTDGLDFAQKPYYSVIILDRMLPGLSGVELLKQLRQLGIKTR